MKGGEYINKMSKKNLIYVFNQVLGHYRFLELKNVILSMRYISYQWCDTSSIDVLMYPLERTEPAQNGLPQFLILPLSSDSGYILLSDQPEARIGMLHDMRYIDILYVIILLLIIF